MGTFVRVTLIVAVAIVAFAALMMLVKLLIVAAVIATLVIGIAFAVRILGGRRGRLRANRQSRVTALTARR